MRRPSPLVLLLPSWTFHTAHAQESNAAASTELDVNFRVSSYECSHHGKEWRICTDPNGWGGGFYCPAYSEYNETELAKPESGNFDVFTPLTPCFTCPGSDTNCSQVVAEVFTANNIGEDQNSTLGESNLWEAALYYCAELCKMNEEGEACTQGSQCTPGALFCDYSAGDTEYTNGICRACPTNPDECFEAGFAATVQGQHNCRDCRLDCVGAADSVLWIDGEIIPSQPIDEAMQASRQSASGPLYDCSELVLSGNAICEGAEGKMCLIEYKQQFALTWQVSRQAEKSGCVGVIAFIEGYDHPISNSLGELLIPYVYIPIEDGKRFRSTKIGTIAKVEVDVFGAVCYPPSESNMCGDTWPCDKGNYCDFKSVPIAESDLFAEGNCVPCPDDPIACYFDSRKDGISDVNTITTKTVQRVQECAAACGAELTSKGCKFCTSDVSAFEFGVESKENQCIFCPQYDVQYPDRVVPLFGENVKCWQLESFFRLLPVPEDSRNCQLAQSMNYICGCQGTGYAGASTLTKQAVLAWMPRVAAILSILGSAFIIVDTQRTPRKRSKTINKILCTISIFDILGSFAMAFTTLPTPSTDYLYGAKGNNATCDAQAFFIQMGTIACLVGVSLSVYYNLAIKQGWSEAKMKRKYIIYYLLIPPIVVGLIFAGVGFLFYDNVMVWCNNSASWWPEIPVILAIFFTTVVMGDVCLSVYKKEKASSRYTGGKTKLSKMVFRQALFFVGAFYITWVPYLTLQYMWSSGTGYDIYGLTLAAATMVPLQGFWNFCVYARPRYFNRYGLSVFRSSVNSIRAEVKRRLKFSKATAVPQTTQSGTTAHALSETNKSSLKSSGANKSSVELEEEVVPFGAPDPDKPDVVPFGIPDPKEESKIDDSIVNDAKQADTEGANEEVEDEDARFEMCLAG